MTGSDLEHLARSGARITIFVALENGVELCDLRAEMTAVVGDEHNLPIVVAETTDGREIRLPVDTGAAAALVVATTGGRL